MKAINRKERQNAIFKFSLIYALSIFFVGFLIFQIEFLNRSTDQDGPNPITEANSEDFVKLENESEFLQKEIIDANEFMENALGGLESIDESLNVYYLALQQSGGNVAILNPDILNNKDVAEERIDSMDVIIRKGYKVDKKINDTLVLNPTIVKSLTNLDGIMNSFISELKHRNELNSSIILRADDFISCRATLKKLQNALNCSDALEECEIHKSTGQRIITQLEDKNRELTERLGKECEVTLEEFNDCNEKREILQEVAIVTNARMLEIAGDLKGGRNKGEGEQLEALSVELLKVLQKQ